MNWRTVRVIFDNELRMLLRDRRTIVVAVLLPLLLYPVVLYVTRTNTERSEKTLAATVFRYAIAGSQAETVRQYIRQARDETARRAETGSGQADTSSSEAESFADFKCQEAPVTDPAASLKAGEIHFYLEGLNSKEADAFPKSPEYPRREERDPDATPAPERLPGVPMIVISYQGNEDTSRAGSEKMRSLLSLAQRLQKDEVLRRSGVTLHPEQLMTVTQTSLATAAQVSGSQIGRYLTAALLIFLLSAGSIVAMDSIAGEKERGSLETLLTTAARRSEIVAAKQLLIVTVALAVTIIQFANLLAYVTFKIVKLPKSWVLEVPPGTIATMLVLFVPLAAFTAAILLMISAYAKSYKEAQLYFFPVYLVSMVPALAGALPGIALRSAIVLVPLANVSVAVREIMVGRFDWPMIVAVFLVMSGAAVWAVRASASMLAKESLIMATETDTADPGDGSARYSRHVLRWYAVLGVVLFAVALNVPQLSTFRAQVLFNEIVIFLGGAFLIIWKYKLNARSALALRRVRPVTWVAVLLAIPSGLVVATGVFRLANLLFPVPRKLLEQFGGDMMPANVPLWQMFLLIAILPGICEEIAFRGTLLYGLRRRFRPVALALVVGIVFGFFHVALFRIIPTAFLGIILTSMALLTGSIFPGIAAHAGNNGLSLWLTISGISVANLSWPWYVASVVVLALAFYLLWRTRTPYPDIRR